MDISFTPGVPNDNAKAAARMRKMQEASAKLTTEDTVSYDMNEDAQYIAEAVRCARTNYGTKTITEGLRPSPADPTAQRKLKPMKCTQCQYRGEPAMGDGKCKECGAAMVPMMTNTEDFPPKDDAEGVPPPDSVDASGQPQQGDPNAGGAPGGLPPGMSPMPPGEPDDGKNDDFDASDQPEVGEMVAYAINGRGKAGRVQLVFRGEASIDTGRKNNRGASIIDMVRVSLLSRIPESILAATGPANGRTIDHRNPEVTRPTVESRSKSKAQKLIEQVAKGRRTADQAVEALLS